jgi:hypothetical protein
MGIQPILAEFSSGGWFKGAIIGGLVGLAIGGVYKRCFGNPGRQA